MEIRTVKLTPKKTGKGYVTSYIITIGCAEVRKCGFIDESGQTLPIEKIVDIENGRIILQPQKK